MVRIRTWTKIYAFLHVSPSRRKKWLWITVGFFIMACGVVLLGYFLRYLFTDLLPNM